MEALAEACAGASVVVVVGASVVLVLLVVVSGGSGGSVLMVGAEATLDFDASADEHAASVKASAMATFSRPRGRISILITAFDLFGAAIVPHFSDSGAKRLKVVPRNADT
jgi:hypothetical protein